jgi:hypothetical protein
MMHIIFGLAIAPSRQFQTDFLRQAIDVPAGNSDLSHHLEHLRRQLMRFHLRCRRHNLAQDGCAIAVRVQLQMRTLREKKTGGKPDSSPSVRGAGSCRRVL